MFYKNSIIEEMVSFINLENFIVILIVLVILFFVIIVLLVLVIFKRNIIKYGIFKCLCKCKFGEYVYF